jgi:CheY-like chemotaxis protein
MMSIALPQFGPAGKFAGYTGASFDITSLKQAELSLRTADQRKDEFIAMLAHELRNPLAPITNIVKMMRAQPLDAKTLEWAHEVLDRQLRNIGRMVGDLLDVSRISHGKIQLHPESVELSELVTHAVDALRATIEASEKEIAIELPTAPVVMFADPVRLEQVIGNLVHNAVKFTPQGGHISVRATLNDGENEVRLSIRDDGDGIAHDALPRVFDLFVQGNTSLDRAQGGLGIGLTLVRGLVELHGGTIEAKSDGPGQGSEFVMTLPLLDVPAVPASRPAAVSEATGPQRILIVDDNVDAATALAAVLRQDGHVVAVTHSGPVAIEAARTFQPQVALVDLGMPGMNGFEVAERLRAADRDLVLIAVSGYSGEESRRRAHEAHFDEYVIKPLDPEALKELLSHAR